MKIGLIDADMMWRPRANGRRYGRTKADVYPNLALMKISAWHKERLDDVGWYNPMDGHYDTVYISKVFADTPVSGEVINASRVVYGGSGFQIELRDGKETWSADAPSGWPMKAWQHSLLLPDEIEHMMPDYSLYPMVKDTAYGFLTHGCPRRCSFCHVAAKEGCKSVKVADLKEWWSGQRNIVLMDPNILACPQWKNLLQQLADSGAKVDINQGIDARLMTVAKAKALSHVRLSTIHFAWDRYKDREKVLKGIKLFIEHYPRKLDKGHSVQVFVLVNFDSTWEEDLQRVYELREIGAEAYIMIYAKQHAAPRYKSLQRWVNNRAIFHKVATFEEYDRRKAKE